MLRWIPRQIVPIAARLVVHLLLRTIPTVLICVGLYVVLLAQFIVIHDDDLASSCLGEVRHEFGLACIHSGTLVAMCSTAALDDDIATYAASGNCLK